MGQRHIIGKKQAENHNRGENQQSRVMGIQSDPEEEEKPEEYNIVKEHNKINPEVGDEEALEK